MDLSEKYRPQSFSEMWQSDAPAIRAVRAEIQQNSLASPMLTQADYGEGKTTLARLIGRRASCRSTDRHPWEPCNDCDGCRSMRIHRSTTHTDYGYFEIDCTQYNAAQVREMINAESQGGIHASSLGRIVICLDEIGRRDTLFQRQLLKIVENARAHIILCAGHGDPVDRALAERCVKRPLPTPTTQECIQALTRIAESEKFTLGAGTAAILATRSGCNPRRILKTLSTAVVLSDGIVTLNLIEEAIGMNFG